MPDGTARPMHGAVQHNTAPPILPLVVRGLVYETSGGRLIDGIDLELTDGPLTVILGPNGAGKSLTLRLLHGLLQPSAGTIQFAGRPPDRSIGLRQAMVFQRPVLLRRSAGANIRYALKLRGASGAELDAREREALERADLAHLRDRPARLLSVGEQQRLAMARALSLRPDILFLDEPTASLDPASVLRIEALIEDARRCGVKIVLVTHDCGQARRLADEVVFLHHGRVAETGAAPRFFRTPSSIAGKAFLEGAIVL